MQPVSIIMYHYVRAIADGPYPEIKGLETSLFAEQIEYLEKHYHFVTVEECLQALQGNLELPTNSVLLTFDDGYTDHFDNVFPILSKKGIQGCFFPPAKAIQENEILDVNKIHFILASVEDKAQLIEEIFNQLDLHRTQFKLEANEVYYDRLAKESRYDTKDVIFIKRLLQVALDIELRETITDELFNRFVTGDQVAFAKELYMDMNQIQHMSENGMYIGSHGYNHFWLNSLTPDQQEKEIDLSLDFLRRVGAPTHDWVMCYPYGGYNDSLLKILKQKKCALGLSTNVGIADLSRHNALTLERLDTNDIPKQYDAKPNEWAMKVAPRG